MRFFILGFALVAGFVFSAQAQTPQQLEMLKNRGDYGKGEASEPVYIDEKTGEVVIPTNTNSQTVELDDGSKVQMPMAKTDAEVKATRRGPNLKLFEQMNEEQQKKYIEYLIQDRIFILTSNYEITTTPTGLKYCQMQLSVKNNTPRKLKKIRISYKWGDTKTYADFSNIDSTFIATHPIALVGSVCNRVLEGAKYEIGECSMEGLTQEQCRLRIAEL